MALKVGLIRPYCPKYHETELYAGYLLRVPKAGTSAYHYSELQCYWETSVCPLFQEGELVQQHLIQLNATGDIITRLNAVLEGSEAARRDDFRGSRVSDATVGMLVEDMAKKHPGDVVFEFKPKWLAQSPSAPPSATRCRNCAREVQKRNERPKPSKTAKPIDCPLDLLGCGADAVSLSQAIASLAPSLEPSSRNYARLADWLKTNTLLPRLRDLQTTLDPSGPLVADAHDPNFQLAMTLRDCSCFVRIPADPESPVEVRVADLDKKNWQAKLEYWQATEQGLIDEGYYEGKEQIHQQTSCILERQSR